MLCFGNHGAALKNWFSTSDKKETPRRHTDPWPLGYRVGVHTRLWELARGRCLRFWLRTTAHDPTTLRSHYKNNIVSRGKIGTCFMGVVVVLSAGWVFRPRKQCSCFAWLPIVMQAKPARDLRCKQQSESPSCQIRAPAPQEDGISLPRDGNEPRLEFLTMPPWHSKVLVLELFCQHSLGTRGSLLASSFTAKATSTDSKGQDRLAR